jgi:tetratricopeptide (TPR) repeat protein
VVAALDRLTEAAVEIRTPLELVHATWLAASGDTGALDALDRVRSRSAGTPALEVMVRSTEPHFHWFLADLAACAASSRAIASASLASGHEWHAADVEWMAAISEVFLGNFEVAEAGLDEIEQRATRVGHQGARVVIHQLRGILAASRGRFDEAVGAFVASGEIGRAAQSPWVYFPDLTLGTQAFQQGRVDEGLTKIRDVVAIEPDTYWCFLSRAYLLRALASVDPVAAAEYLRAHEFRTPEPGRANPHGAWSALPSLVEALALLGRDREVVALLPASQEAVAQGLAIAGAWPVSYRTCAGMTAAYARRWDVAATHFEAAIQQADTLPHVATQPAARTWYAEMLVRRAASGDRDRARALLNEAVAICDRYGLAVMGERAQQMRSHLGS